MDVGTLTGNIELEDQLSSALTIITSRVKQFAEGFNNIFGAIAIGAGAVVTAIAGITGAIVTLGVQGTTINDVEGAFDTLAKQAGSTGDALIRGLSGGVRDTVDSMVLMQTTTRALQAGVKLSEADMKALGATARAMGKATGTDATQGLQTLSNALTTGQLRAVKMAGVTVDLEKAQKNLAKELGVEVKNLSDSGKLHAARTAIMEGARAKLAQLGDSELSFKEKILAANVAIGNWFDTLKKSVASSPAVNKALDDIGTALVKAFGGGSQTLLQTVVSWVDKFANAVSTYGPPAIEWIGDIGRKIYEIWQYVRQAWDDVPDWFKEIAKEAVVAGVAVGVVHQGISLMTGSDALTTIASFATIWSGFGKAITGAATAVKGFLGVLVLTTQIGGVTALLQGLGTSFAGLLSTPLGAASAITAFLYAGLKLSDWLGREGPNWLPKGLGLIGGAMRDIELKAESSAKAVRNWVGAMDKFDVPKRLADTDNDRANKASLVDLREVEEQRRKILQEGLAKELTTRTFYAGMRNRQRDSENEIALNQFLEFNAHIDKLRAENLAHEVARERAAATAKNKARDDEGMAAYNLVVERYEKIEKYSSASLRNEAREARRVYEEMARRSGEFSSETIDHFKEVADQADRTAAGLKGGLSNSVAALGDAFSNLAEISGGAFGGIMRDIGEFIAVLDIAGKAGKAMDSGIDRIGKGFDSLGKKGITTAQSIGEMAAGFADLATGAMAAYGAIQKATDSMSRAKNVASGAATGAKIGAQAGGGAGAIVGAIAGAIWGWVKSNTIESRLVSPLRDAFFEMQGGLERLNPLLMQVDGNMSKVQAVFNAKTPQQYEAAIKALTDAIDEYNMQMKEAENQTLAATGKMRDMVILTPELEDALQNVYDAGNAEEYVAALKAMNGLLDEQAAKQQFLEQTMQKYGLQWTDLGEKARAAHVAVEAASIEKEFRALAGAGADANVIMRAMGNSISDFVLSAVKTGTEVPESFRDIIQTAIDAGEIFSVSTEELEKMREEAEKLGKPFDDTKYKVTDLEKYGVHFGTTMEKATANVATAIERLAKILEDRLAPAIRNIPDVEVEVKYDDGKFPTGGYGEGGSNVVPFKPRGGPTGLPSMPAAASSLQGASGGGTAVINVDGRVLTEVVVPRLPGVVKKYGLGRR